MLHLILLGFGSTELYSVSPLVKTDCDSAQKLFEQSPSLVMTHPLVDVAYTGYQPGHMRSERHIVAAPSISADLPTTNASSLSFLWSRFGILQVSSFCEILS